MFCYFHVQVLGQLFQVAGPGRGTRPGEKSSISRSGTMTLGNEGVEFVELDVTSTEELVQQINALAATLRRPWIDVYNGVVEWKKDKPENAFPRSKSCAEASKEETDLAAWVGTQKQDYAKGKLVDSRGACAVSGKRKQELLEALPGWIERAGGEYGWNADYQAESWNDRYVQLKQWKDGKEETDFPSKTSASEEEKSLASWVEGQQSRYNKGTLVSDRNDPTLTESKKRELLDALPGWCARVGGSYGYKANQGPQKRFMESYNDFLAWKMNRPGDWSKDMKKKSGSSQLNGEAEVGKWVRNHLHRYNHGLIKDGVGKDGISGAKKIELLEKVPGWKEKAGGGYGWKKGQPKPVTWRERYDELVKLLPRTDTQDLLSAPLDVLNSVQLPPGLSRWLENQKRAYKAGSLGDERRRVGSTSGFEKKRLSEALPDWKSMVGGDYGYTASDFKTWREKYASVLEIKNKRGADVWPLDSGDEKPFYGWMRTQTEKYKYKKLANQPGEGGITAEEKCERLEELPGWKKKAGRRYGWASTDGEPWKDIFESFLSWRAHKQPLAWPGKTVDTLDDEALMLEVRLYWWVDKQIKSYKKGNWLMKVKVGYLRKTNA